MGVTTAIAQTMLDYAFPTTGGTDYIAYSENGSSESSILARTAVGATNWAAATAADPSIKSNTAGVTSAAASGAGTISHFAIYSASTGGTQRTDWQALGASRALTAGDKLEWAAGALDITLT